MNCNICSHVLGGGQTCTTLCSLGEKVARDLNLGPRPNDTAVIEPHSRSWKEPGEATEFVDADGRRWTRAPG